MIYLTMRNRFFSGCLFIALLYSKMALAASLSASPWSGQKMIKLEYNEKPLAYSQVINTTFLDSSLAQNTWMQIALTNSRFLNTRLSGTQASKSEFSDLVFENSDLSGFKCTLCTFINTTFKNSNLDGAHFLAGSFKNTHFVDSNLSRVDFVSTRFENCSVDSKTAKTVHPAMLIKWKIPVKEQP
ncbi:pentapeptide repeat-containing protein [Bdellovibrio bacteriovorus]|uniref:Pentapeptide repeat-containing protein n=2 Tax=Bdellovibrio bacteriovorus TaxID=959 RepID=Q6MJB4_BDEBA|nr:pentapeptide repeat-containing protein [Bdellovibrio bacteriovorus]CAE80647.1 hypothetical protein predicted by Glimmer/Critica [Bdellovibrio bacteriovorus HD100]